MQKVKAFRIETKFFNSDVAKLNPVDERILHIVTSPYTPDNISEPELLKLIEIAEVMFT